jgi:hypothetical protein
MTMPPGGWSFNALGIGSALVVDALIRDRR